VTRPTERRLPPIGSEEAAVSKTWFLTVANSLSRWAGHAATFIGAIVVVAAWAVLGPLFGFSDTWQLVINTSTTIITFLMVFLIQNTQNRDTAAIQTKLDELIRAIDGANNALLDLEQLDDKAIGKIREPYEELARREREAIQSGASGSGTDPVPGS
jgi:low affinity Fe/Cu permease